MTKKSRSSFLSDVDTHSINIDDIPDPPTPEKGIVRINDFDENFRNVNVNGQRGEIGESLKNKLTDKRKRRHSCNDFQISSATNIVEKVTTDSLENVIRRRKNIDGKPPVALKTKTNVKPLTETSTDSTDFLNDQINPNVLSSQSRFSRSPKNDFKRRRSLNPELIQKSQSTFSTSLQTEKKESKIEFSVFSRDRFSEKETTKTKLCTNDIANDKKKLMLQRLIREYCSMPLSIKLKTNCPLVHEIEALTGYKLPSFTEKNEDSNDKRSYSPTSEQRVKRRQLLAELCPVVEGMESYKDKEELIRTEGTQCKAVHSRNGGYEYFDIKTDQKVSHREYQRRYLSFIRKKKGTLKQSEEKRERSLCKEKKTRKIEQNEGDDNIIAETIQSLLEESCRMDNVTQRSDTKPEDLYAVKTEESRGITAMNVKTKDMMETEKTVPNDVREMEPRLERISNNLLNGHHQIKSKHKVDKKIKTSRSEFQKESIQLHLSSEVEDMEKKLIIAAKQKLFECLSSALSTYSKEIIEIRSQWRNAKKE